MSDPAALILSIPGAIDSLLSLHDRLREAFGRKYSNDFGLSYTQLLSDFIDGLQGFRDESDMLSRWKSLHHVTQSLNDTTLKYLFHLLDDVPTTRGLSRRDVERAFLESATDNSTGSPESSFYERASKQMGLIRESPSYIDLGSSMPESYKLPIPFPNGMTKCTHETWKVDIKDQIDTASDLLEAENFIQFVIVVKKLKGDIRNLNHFADRRILDWISQHAQVSSTLSARLSERKEMLMLQQGKQKK